MRCANVLKLPTRLVVHPMNRTTAGVWVFAEPCTSLEPASSPEAVGAAVLSALACSVSDAEHPTDWAEFGKRRLSAFGVTSEAKLHAGRLVHVEAVGGQLTVAPTRNGGATGPTKGFSNLSEKSILVHDDPLPTGLAVIRAISECEP
jgi:hypothetical protein